jgi:hypothetical protein
MCNLWHRYSWHPLATEFGAPSLFGRCSPLTLVPHTVDAMVWEQVYWKALVVVVPEKDYRTDDGMKNTLIQSRQTGHLLHNDFFFFNYWMSDFFFISVVILVAVLLAG